MGRGGEGGGGEECFLLVVAGVCKTHSTIPDRGGGGRVSGLGFRDGWVGGGGGGGGLVKFEV